VIEPGNLTAWVDRFGDTWVRVDDCPGRFGNWWPLMDGPGWEPWARQDVGQPRDWDQVEYDYAPLVEADPQRTAEALERVRLEVAK
jgi:hypothetical protein